MTPEYLRSILHYDPDSGVFTRRATGKIAGSGKSGYRKISINNRSYWAHRLAWAIMMGEWPPETIDHKDGDGSNNRWDNLRAATRQQNQQNRRRHKSNGSGFKGITKNKHGITWSAAIYQKGRKIHIGNFPTAEAAHSAYCIAARAHYGEFARTA